MIQGLLSILERYNVEDRHMDISCSDELLKLVRDEMKSYSQVATGLHISEQETCEDNPCDEEERKLAVLMKWKSKNGSAATCRCLAEAFAQMKDLEMAELIVSYVRMGYFTHRHKQSRPDQRPDGDVMPGQALERFPSWECMEYEEQDRVKTQLFEENERVQEEYASCLTRIRKGLSSDVHEVKLALTLKMSKRGVVVPELESAETLDQVFLVIARHTSWFNYGLLEFLVNALHYKSGKQILKAYEDEHLNPYLERSIFLVSSKSLSVHASSSYVPCVMLFDDINDLSAKEAEFVKMRLANQLKIPSLQLTSYDIGSVCLCFGIYKEIFEHELHQEGSLLQTYIQWSDEKSSYVFTIDIFTLL